MKSQDAFFLLSILLTFIPKVLELPHYSANVVRVFRRINLSKTKL